MTRQDDGDLRRELGPLTYEGIPIVVEPSFDEPSGLRNHAFLIPPEAARELARAEESLKRGLTTTEILSVLIHKSAKIILEEE